MSDVPAPKPWERQPEEPEPAFLLFQRYRDRRPPRGRVYEATKGAAGHVETLRLFQDWHWKERAAAWDAHIEAIRLHEVEEVARVDARDRAKEHLLLTNDLLQLALREARKWLRAAEESDMTLIKPADLIKLTDLVVKLERLIKGQPTERVEHGRDLSHLTDDELEQVEALLSKGAADPEPGTSGAH